MSNARRMKPEEILSLPQGAVVWYEDHCVYDDPGKGVYAIPFYCLYPLMVSEAGKGFALIGACEGCAPDYWTADAVPYMRIWDKKPDRKQLKGFCHLELDNIPEETLREMTESQGTGNNALKQRIIWEFGSLTTFAYRIEMKPSTLMKKLNGKSEFYYLEMISIMKALRLNANEMTRYFFPDELLTEKIS